MARTSYTGYVRQYGATKSATPAVLPAMIQFTFDPTQSFTGTGKIIPKGAIVLYAQNINGFATGGISPTIDIGLEGDPDAFGIEVVADAPSGLVVNGIAIGQPLISDFEIFAGVGASAATGGSVLCAVHYMMPDDGSA